MIDVAFAGIYSFASEPHNNGLIEDIFGKLHSLSAEVAIFGKYIASKKGIVPAMKMPRFWTALKDEDPRQSQRKYQLPIIRGLLHLGQRSMTCNTGLNFGFSGAVPIIGINI
jgi:hypothetical protein